MWRKLNQLFEWLKNLKKNLIKYQLDTSCGQNKLLPSKETKESQLWAREQELIHAKEVHVI